MPFLLSLLPVAWPEPLRKLAARAIVALAIVALALALWALWSAWLGGERKQAATEAVATERAATASETLKQVERANEAVETIRRNPDARRADCLRDSRNSENC